MPFDKHTPNFAYSLVATAPSPATSGVSLVVTAGQGSRFPTPPFNATIWPASSQPTPANAEIVRVTAISTDTLTIGRAQESTTARTIIVGDQIAATGTAQTFTDIEAGFSPDMPLTPLRVVRDNVIAANTGVRIPDTMFELGAGLYGSTDTTGNNSISGNVVYATPVTLPANATLAEIVVYSIVAAPGQFNVNGNMRVGVYQDSGGVPGHLLYSITPQAFLVADTSLRFRVPTANLGTVVGPSAWLAFQSDTSNALIAAAGVTLGSGFVAATYAGGLPDPFGTSAIGTTGSLQSVIGLVGGTVEIGADAVLEIGG